MTNWFRAEHRSTGEVQYLAAPDAGEWPQGYDRRSWVMVALEREPKELEDADADGRLLIPEGRRAHRRRRDAIRRTTLEEIVGRLEALEVRAKF